MGLAEDLVAKMQGQQDAEELKKYESDPGFLGGFVSSTVSSVGELFGQDPWATATDFRQENPWSGLASEIIGTAVPYAGAFKISKIGKFASMLEKGTERVGTAFGAAEFTAASAPVRYGMVKEILRYSPLELSRLGVGYATAPDGNFGDLLADVGLSTVLAGGAGALGGFFRAGGADAPITGNVLGKEMGLKPTFELRMGLADNAQVTGDLPLADVLAGVRNEVLTEVPYTHRLSSQSGRYVDGLENGSPEADRALNRLLFKAQSSNREAPGIGKRLLVEGADDDLRTIGYGEQERIVAAAGFDSIDDLASTVVYPRVVDIKSPRGAGTFAKAIDDSTGFMMVEPGVMMGREAGDGLWVVAKRLKAGGLDDPNAITKGTAKIVSGDQWLIGKTDKPQRFAPQMHKIAEDTVNRWAKFEPWAKPSESADWANVALNLGEDAMSPMLYDDIHKMSRAKWLDKADKAFTDKILGEAGLKGSTVGRRAAEHFYDVFATTASKEKSNSVYGRLMGQLRNVMTTATTETKSMVRGAVKLGDRSPLKATLTKFDRADEWENGLRTHNAIFRSISDEEANIIRMASKTQTPADDLEKLVNGPVSPQLRQAVKDLQANDSHFISTRVSPSLEAGGVAENFTPLQGYAMPAFTHGDYSATIVNEKGVAQYLATGSLTEVKAEVAGILKEGAEKGFKWSMKEPQPFHAVERDPAVLDLISDTVTKQLRNNPDVQEVLQGAMKKLAIARGQNRSGGGVGAPGSFKERTGLERTDKLMSKEDMLAGIENHYNGLMKFAAYHNWRQRYMQLATSLEKDKPIMSKDLQDKAQQMMGIDGKLTKLQNEKLSKLMGPVLGAKSATKIAQVTNQTMAVWNLMFANPTHALLNLLSPLQQVMPWVSHMTTLPPDRVARMMNTAPRFNAQGQVVGVMSSMSPIKVMKQSMASLRNPSDELRGFQEQALTDGTLLPQHYEGFTGSASEGAQTLSEAWKQDGMAKFLYKGSTWMADKSEQLSRMIGFNAAYHVGKEFFELEGDHLYKFVVQGTRTSMYGYSTIDRARMFTGPVGSMFGLFKNWQWHFMSSMMEYAGEATKGNFAPLMWQSGTALALGGLGATPLKMIADGVINYSTNGETESSFLWLQEKFGKDVADPVFYGLPSFLGVSLQASATMPGTDVRNETSNLFNAVILQKAMQLGKVVGNAYDQAEATGTNPLRDSNVRDQLIGALAPRAVFRAVSVMEGDYVKSMTTGAPQVQGVSVSDRVIQGMGLTAVDVAKQQYAAAELWKSDEAMKSMIAGMGKSLADANMNGDRDEATAIIKRAVAMGVPVDSVVKSAQTREARETTGDNLGRFKEEKVLRYRNAFGE